MPAFILSWQQRCDLTAKWLIVATAFFLSLPAAWAGVGTGLFMLTWLLGGNYRQRWITLRSYPFALIGLGLLGWMALASLWASNASWAERGASWWHYREFLLLPLMLSVIDDPRWGRRILFAFAAGMALALVVSYLRWLGVMPHSFRGGIYGGFGGRTGFSISLALLAYLCLWVFNEKPRYHWVWAILGLLALHNLFLVNDGRTGQLIFLGMMPLILFRWLRWRGLALGALLAALVFAAGYLALPGFKGRIDQTVTDIQGFKQGKTDSNDGIRMEFWKNTLVLIAEHPIVGSGTGAFIPAYREQAQKEDLADNHATRNPHQEYLLIWCQHGIPGLLLFFAVWASQWRAALRQPVTQRYLTLGLIVSFFIGDFFNSLIYDMWEGHIYVLLSVALATPWTSADSRT